MCATLDRNARPRGQGAPSPPFVRRTIFCRGSICWAIALTACSLTANPHDGGTPVAPTDATEVLFDGRLNDGGDAANADAASPLVAPWPPAELANGPDPQPEGVGWRTAQWNVCTTAMDEARLECRARIKPDDPSRSAAQLERAAIAKYFSEDANMYSFTLQEVCEQDARWIAAFVANEGPPIAGWNRDFDAAEYALIATRAPYVFLPYQTHELAGTRDFGCGPGISTGIAAIAKHQPGTTEPKLRGLTHATYHLRETTGLTRAALMAPEVCAWYFDAQTSYGPTDPGSGQYEAVGNFRSSGCASAIPSTLRGLACVRTRWQGPGDSTTYRVSTCVTHAVHKGSSAWSVRNRQIESAAIDLLDFTGGNDQRSILSGDFNVVADRGQGLDLSGGEQGHHTILSDPRHGFTKITVGDHATSNRTGTFRGGSATEACGRQIDAIYARSAWWLQSASPNASICRSYPASDPATSIPAINPYEWSDHEMMVSPLMSPHGSGTSDL